MAIFFDWGKNGMMRSIIIALYLAVIIFLIISLISYNATDSSLIYSSSDGVKIANACGFLGAYSAAVLIYFFGKACYLIIIPLIWGLYVYSAQRSLYQEWERLLASLYVVCVSAAGFSIIKSNDGGIIGLYFARSLLHYGDDIGRVLFLIMSMIICVVLLLRWNFVGIGKYAIASVAVLNNVIKHYHVVSYARKFFISLAYVLIIRPVQLLKEFVVSLYNGKAFDDTGLVVPHEYNEEGLYVVRDDCNFFMMTLVKSEKKGVIKKTMTFVVLFSKNKQQDDAYKGSVRDVNQEEVLSQNDLEFVVTMPLKKVSCYLLPELTIFRDESVVHQNHDLEKELQERAYILQDKLKRFGVAGNVVAIKRGPVVTLFEYQPDIDTKLSKITALEDDLAMALQAMSIRILAPIPGRSVVGFEVANNNRNDVLFSHIVRSPLYEHFTGSLPLVLGKGTIGEVVVVDLAHMPHLLIAGSTGSGKSVALNAILISLLCKLNPDELKLILIDPKRLEFASFTDIPHLLFPIVTNSSHAAPVLRWVVEEMEERYEKMAQCGARNINDYNTRVIKDKDYEPLPFIVVVIDELADLMITAGRDIEDLITRITQMARAAGIHMIVATQRPSVDVITGLIKANFPSRISFRVASRIDSRTILDTMGADRLLGRGDMLFLDAATSQLKRVHGAYVSDEEIEKVADHIRFQRKVEYLDQHTTIIAQGNTMHSIDDVLYENVRQFLDEVDEISISLLQRKFRIGYNRSARIIDMLESQGLIMPQGGSKTRKVIR